MKSLKEYIRINEGIFDPENVTFKDFSTANELLEIVNLDNSVTKDKCELKKIYFNTDLKLEDGTTVKDNVNKNKADFKKYGLANYVTGSTTSEMKTILAKYDKADKEIGPDTMGTADGTLIVRMLKLDNGKEEPMAIVVFNK